MKSSESFRQVDAFGGTTTIYGSGDGLEEAFDHAESLIRSVHSTLTRFDPASELCRMNADSRSTVSASPVMLEFAEAVRSAGELSDGLVDSTCLDAVEHAGYTRSMAGSVRESNGSTLVMEPAAERKPPAGSWRDLEVDRNAGTISRPAGLRLDAGGLGKGLAADLAAGALGELDTFAVECLGELRFGGTSGQPRLVEVASPDRSAGPIASLSIPEGAIATSGITKRSWVNSDGKASHHLIDPRNGSPVYSGVVQVTALATTALEAEVRAKSALISGPALAMNWLPGGGVVVLDDDQVRLGANFREADGRR